MLARCRFGVALSAHPWPSNACALGSAHKALETGKVLRRPYRFLALSPSKPVSAVWLWYPFSRNSFLSPLNSWLLYLLNTYTSESLDKYKMSRYLQEQGAYLQRWFRMAEPVIFCGNCGWWRDVPARSGAPFRTWVSRKKRCNSKGMSK